METERIELRTKERERLPVRQEVEPGHGQQMAAARRRRLSDRHVQRWPARLRAEEIAA